MDSRTLKLSDARKQFMDPIHGYVGQPEWAEELFKRLQTAVDHLGDPNIEDITHAHYRKLWKGLAAAHATEHLHGARATELIISALRVLMMWLAEQGKIQPGTGLPALKWKKQMHEDWERITGRPIAPPKRLRYSREEEAKLRSALPQAEPRLRVPFELLPEARLGQLIRTRRSDIKPHNGNDIGAVRVHGRGKKHGTTIVLTDEQRAVIIAELNDGVFANLERAYQAREIKDYLLIPGEFLARRRAQLKNAMTPVMTGTVRNWWDALEEKAGVEHLAGRGWHGLRRRSVTARENSGPSINPTQLNVSPEEEALISAIEQLLPSAAASYRQGLADLRSDHRVSYRGTVVEFREALREVLDHLAPDAQVMAQEGFELEANRSKPTMKQQVRFILKMRGYNKTKIYAPEKSVVMIDERIGEVTRAVYDRASLGTHITQLKAEVNQIKRFVDTVLFDILDLRAHTH